NPGIDFAWLRSTMPPTPRSLDFVQDCLPVTDVLFEHCADFLLHRAAISASKVLERSNDLGRNVSNRQRCHISSASRMLAFEGMAQQASGRLTAARHT